MGTLARDLSLMWRLEVRAGTAGTSFDVDEDGVPEVGDLTCADETSRYICIQVKEKDPNKSVTRTYVVENYFRKFCGLVLWCFYCGKNKAIKNDVDGDKKFLAGPTATEIQTGPPIKRGRKSWKITNPSENIYQTHLRPDRFRPAPGNFYRLQR